MLTSVYGSAMPFARIRVHHGRWAWPFPNDRAMAPNGHIYMPGQNYAADYATPGVDINRKATFIHEGAHLYQWYVLGWNVWARGPFSRNYGYKIVPNMTYQQYGLEQMGMIAQHYFLLRSGVRPSDLPDPNYTLESYSALLPVR